MAAMEPPVWERIDGASLWDRFDDRFAFRAGPTADRWPAIDEPAGSVTFSLAPIFGDGGGEWLRHAVNFAVVWALAEVVGADDPLLALSWQHPSYCFWPHRNVTIHPSEMLGMHHITPIPDGDYFAFVSADLGLGTFGHPWEATLCLWGEDLVALLSPMLGSLLPVARAN